LAIDIKRAQLCATGAYDFFAMPRRASCAPFWPRPGPTILPAYYRRFMRARRCSPRTSAARRCRSFTGGSRCFDRAHAELAPGWILLRELIAATPQLGVTRIDLGPGEEELQAPGDDRLALGGPGRGNARPAAPKVAHSPDRRPPGRHCPTEDSPLKPKLSAMRAAGYRPCRHAKPGDKRAKGRLGARRTRSAMLPQPTTRSLKRPRLECAENRTYRDYLRSADC